MPKLSFTEPVMLPGGKALIVDGKFNKKAQDCCCCVAYTPFIDGSSPGTLIVQTLTVDPVTGLATDAYSPAPPQAGSGPPYTQLWDRTLSISPGAFGPALTKYDNEAPMWLDVRLDEQGDAYLGWHTFDDGHVGWVIWWGDAGDIDASSGNPIDFSLTDWAGELCSPTGGSVGPRGVYKRIGGINLAKQVVVT